MFDEVVRASTQLYRVYTLLAEEALAEAVAAQGEEAFSAAGVFFFLIGAEGQVGKVETEMPSSFDFLFCPPLFS